MHYSAEKLLNPITKSAYKFTKFFRKMEAVKETQVNTSYIALLDIKDEVSVCFDKKWAWNVKRK